MKPFLMDSEHCFWDSLYIYNKGYHAKSAIFNISVSLKAQGCRALQGYHFKCGCVACTHKWPVYDRLVERPPQYKKKLTPEMTMEVIGHDLVDLIFGDKY